MSLTKLQEDLLQEFKEQKQVIYQQLEIFEPLSEKLREPAAVRLLGKGTIILLEIICYAFTGGMIALAVLMNRVYPFSVWDYIQYKGQLPDVEGIPTMADMQNFTIVMHVMCGLAAILFFIIARMLARIRLKNDIINATGKNIKTLVGQHLQRKASLQSIEERHFPGNHFPDAPTDGVKVNDMPNPGF